LTERSVYASIGSVPTTDTADAVVVGGGTVGAWCAWFLRRAGLARVVLIEKGYLGQGASSRAAGVVRVQGGTPEAVRLSSWSRRFYLGQRDEIGTDSGFTEQGYLLPCFTEADVTAARERMAMQAALGVPVRWLDPGEVDAANPTLAPGQTLGGTFCDQDGFVAPPRNVAAYTVALIRGGVDVREHVAFLGPAGRAGSGHRRARAAPGLGRHHRLHPGPLPHHRPGPGPGHRGQRGRGRHDVGTRPGPGHGRRRADRLLRRARGWPSRLGPLRRSRAQPPGHRPHRPALPGEDRLVMITATAVFPRGWAGTGQIHETIRKLYVLF
jgi:FAD dependent oxidoreductase